LGAIYLRGFADAGLANQAVHPPSATASPKEPEDAQAAQGQLEFVGGPIFKAIAATYVYLYFPVWMKAASQICDSGLPRQNLVEFERQIKSGEYFTCC